MPDSHTDLIARYVTGPPPAREPEAEEGECAAFGFLRGTRERATMIEFRLRTGNRKALPYSWLGPVDYDPSRGLLLRFVGDQVYLVLVRGWNLAAPVTGGTDLYERGVLRHRVLWVREMSPPALAKVPKDQVAVQDILIAAGASDAELGRLPWVRDFLRPGAGGEGGG